MADVPEVVVIGGGGHARVVIDAMLEREARSVGVLDADPALAGTSLLGIPVLGNDALLPGLAAGGTRFFVIGLGGTGNNDPRAGLFANALALGLEPLSVVHPSAVVSRFAEIGPGCQILAGAIVNAGARLGRNVIVNTGAVVEHDCTVGDHAHVATGACLASTVAVGERVHVGAGATVRQLLHLGAGCVVGAGAAVVKDVPAGAVVAGVPAKELKP